MDNFKKFAFEISNGSQIYHASDKSLFLMVSKIQNRFNSKKIIWNKMKYLGYGSYGIAYQINRNMVMKITKDKSEIHAMTIVMKNPNKYIVKVYDTFMIKIGTHIRYIIVQELLDKSCKTWGLFIKKIYSNDEFITPNFLNAFKKHNNEYYLNIKNYNKVKWIKSLSLYFEKNNIFFKDLHSNNIMRRKNVHVLIDLGLSKSPKQKFAII